MIRSHPQPDTLMSYASGTLPAAISGVIACHISMCGDCQSHMRLLEMVAGLMLDGMPPPQSDDLFESRALKQAMERSTAAFAPEPAHQRYPDNDDDFLPGPLANYLGMSGDQIPWQRLPKGIRQYWVTVPEDGGHLRILRIPPGAMLLEHTHGGMEATMILRGTYSDYTGDYKRGDVSEMGEGMEHMPTTVSSEGECICIVGSETRPRYSRWYARLLQPLIGY
jgi:putative transcriptional regulator